MRLPKTIRRGGSAAALAFLLPLAGLGGCDTDDPGEPVERDLADIREGDTLTALVTYNSTG